LNEHRFDGRVAVVTGAGRGIGRAYALLLARRGASGVVTDLGGAMDGRGNDTAPAERVAAEIEAGGGAALADANDVATVAGGQAVVDAAVARFGRIDAVINNAGIIRWAGFPEADEENLARHLAVHTVGSFNTARAAWPHMVAAGYGRIVMTTSSGVFGLANNVSYATAKAAVIGLTRSLAVSGAEHGIRVNLIAPAAMTRMAGGGGGRRDEEGPAGQEGGVDSGAGVGAGVSGLAAMAPELVAPMGAYLAHESCPVSGEMYAAGAGRFARVFIATTPGYVHPGPEATMEDVAEHWAAINDEAGYFVPADLMDWSAAFLSHLQAPTGQA
jgi:NAD(P)-dependent dehydrogenase (short-subunit alcohol dehydrogenase family)